MYIIAKSPPSPLHPSEQASRCVEELWEIFTFLNLHYIGKNSQYFLGRS
jgi:hypothetical protein